MLPFEDSDAVREDIDVCGSIDHTLAIDIDHAASANII